MNQLVVVTYPDPVALEARPIEHDAIPEGAVGLGYYHNGNLIARGVVPPDALETIRALLSAPVAVALAATEDDQGNIDARVCLAIPLDPRQLQEDDEGDEPWKASVPPPPPEVDSAYYTGPASDGGQAHLALIPIGNVVRSARDRRHPDNVADDAREMLDNLFAGKAQDAVQKAIDDLLKSI